MAKQDGKTDGSTAETVSEANAILEGIRLIAQQMQADRAAQPLLQAQAFEKVQNPSNRVATGCSVFNPRGEKLDDWQMPALKCEIHAPWVIHPAYHGLDREEVELFNLLEPGEYSIELVDGSSTKLRVVGQRNDVTGAIEKLRIDTTTWNEEHKGKLPAMRAILRQILGEQAAGVLTMRQEVAQIQTGELTASR